MRSHPGFEQKLLSSASFLFGCFFRNTFEASNPTQTGFITVVCGSDEYFELIEFPFLRRGCGRLGVVLVMTNLARVRRGIFGARGRRRFA